MSELHLEGVSNAHGSFTPPEAWPCCHVVRNRNSAWFEEPVTADDKRGLAEVRRGTHLPIASGESDSTQFDFRKLVELRAADIAQPDLAIRGGIGEAMRISVLASASNLRLEIPSRPGAGITLREDFVSPYRKADRWKASNKPPSCCS